MKFISLVVVALSLALPVTARAQGNDVFSWGVNAGVAVPMNYLAKDHDSGVSAGINFAIGGVGQLFGLRFDGMYNQFGAKSGTTAGSTRILGGTANLVMPLIGSGDRLYLTGGAGAYGIRTGVKGVKGVNDFGINGGVGIWLPFANAFIEARYHHFYRALTNKKPATFVPITFGILF